ncbi:hypothetical protein DPSP01_008001 [Paraphaeosphaeria sporulosa]|uniref:PH domain-like protein n=1 Tax=Paraphaeosphaeria sporulosa TaxID=1460663 RepID=A0A177CFL8_9PLEO|nr:PH domain-like protein [Paraphaeosphaeria sporulosa]OAG05588.1 PH domain-like protein [Paraphaeosphaeria sporulosa]
MGPNKGRSRAHHSQPQAPPQPSDYETDAPPNMDYPPPPPGRSNEELNLSVIRRHYAHVNAVHYVAPYAVLYAFSLETEQWEKVGVEGSLFICGLVPSAVGAERYGVVILNRRSMDNFYMEITGPDGLEFTDEYIIMQGDQVYGLWIFCEPPPSSTANTRTETVAKIQELAARVQASQAAVDQTSDASSITSDQVQSSVPMGRQLSLRELFGQQRTQDAAWSVVNHHNTQALHQGYQPTPSPHSGQPDMLNQLFMRAHQDYNNFG